MRKRTNAFLLSVAIAFLPQALCAGERVDPAFKEEVRGLIYHGGDFPSQDAINKAKRLTEMGERAYPALGEILLETSDASRVSNILSVLAKGPGDKTLVRPYLLTFIERVETGTELKGSDGANPSELNMPAVIKLLGQAGSTEDIPLLRRYLQSTELDLRYSAFLSMSLLGDNSIAKELKTWTEAELASADKENDLFDPSVREMFEKALNQMQMRLTK